MVQYCLILALYYYIHTWATKSCFLYTKFTIGIYIILSVIQFRLNLREIILSILTQRRHKSVRFEFICCKRIQEQCSVTYITRFSVQISNKFYHGDINIVFRFMRPKKVGKKQTDKLRVFLNGTIIPCV